MKRMRFSSLAAICLAVGVGMAACNWSDDLPPVTAQDKDGANWTSYGRTHSENHFSPLTQVTSSNIDQLGLAWSHDLDPFPTTFSAPLAVDGTLYFSSGYSVVHAMDARTGKLLWQYDPEVHKFAGQKMRAGWGVRGIGYNDGKVFVPTLDGRLIAVDARTGKPLWSVETLDAQDESYITGPPWVYKNIVVIGQGGADYGPIRGYVTAYDQNTGKQLWRFYTVPGDPAKGFENAAMEMAAKTWKGEWWKFGGGGTVWHAMAYDPQFNRLYLGTGNGSPWNQKIRSPGGGDNLFLSSIVALDADTGEYVWHYQLNPGETWDYNNAMDIELANLKIDGEVRPVLLHAPKNGFFYVIDRRNGKLISAEKFAKVNWAERIDIKTGRPVENPEARYPDGKPFLLYPGPLGAHGIQAMSFSPKTGLVYIPAQEGGRIYTDPVEPLDKWKFTPGVRINNGTGPRPEGMTVPPATSSLLAWDPVKQKEAWRVPLKGAVNGGTLATAGNLVFQGGGDGNLVAYAADTGKPLWTFYAQNGIMAQPISYLVDGKQYVTVITGWRGGPTKPLWEYRTQKRRVLTFALGGTAKLPPEERVDIPFVDDPSFRIDPAKVAAGKKVFESGCQICHGGNMVSGGSAPDLRQSSIPLDLNSLKQVVRDGALRPQGMPSYTDLTDKDLEALQHYIRQRARESLEGK